MSIFTRNAALGELFHRSLGDLLAAEGLTEDTVTRALEDGTMVLLGNRAHSGVRPTLVGQPASIKVNANIGTSLLISDIAGELEKLALCDRAGAHTVMDLSTAGDLTAIRRAMLAASPLPLGTVPLYAAVSAYIAEGRDPAEMNADELLIEIEREALQGVDFMTVHCGVTAKAVAYATNGHRVTGIVSRGGSILGRWMTKNGRENPLYERFDDILDIARAHNVVLSLGDGLRPGSGADAGDPAQWEEVVVLAGLARRARQAGVQTMIEGPGHVPLDQVPAQIRAIKQLTDGAPLYVLGPLTTDCAPGYDHIAAAIGGAVAGMNGADFLCYVTPAEHLTLPGPDDVRQGIMASLVAAQSAETALRKPGAVARNLAMSQARKALDWEAMADTAVDPETVRLRRKDFAKEKECAMCGKFCAMKMLENA